MPYKYSLKYDKEKMARAVIMSAGISLKHSIEICNFVRKKKISEARKMLEDVIKEKRAVPFKRFVNGAGHKKGIGPGKYPKKATAEFIKLFNVAEANAQNKGLSTSDLVIEHVCANKAPGQMHYGRKIRRKMKRTHVEIYVKEGEEKKKKIKEKKKEELVKKEKPVKEKREDIKND